MGWFGIIFGSKAPLPQTNTPTPAPLKKPRMQHINQAGIDLIKMFEGLRLKAYRDPIGIWTIGYGHIKGVHEGMIIAAYQAEDMLREDLIQTEVLVLSVLKVAVSDNEFAALVSFAYNVGIGNLKSSTLLKLLNSGDHSGAADQFPRWNKAGGKELPGLTKRRNAEKSLFLTK